MSGQSTDLQITDNNTRRTNNRIGSSSVSIFVTRMDAARCRSMGHRKYPKTGDDVVWQFCKFTIGLCLIQVVHHRRSTSSQGQCKQSRPASASVSKRSASVRVRYRPYPEAVSVIPVSTNKVCVPDEDIVSELNRCVVSPSGRHRIRCLQRGKVIDCSTGSCWASGFLPSNSKILSQVQNLVEACGVACTIRLAALSSELD